MLKLDGWWCTACRTWNGPEHEICRCGGSRLSEEGLPRDELFRIVAAMVSERNAALETATRMQERISAFVEVARCAKALLDAEQVRDEALSGNYVATRQQLVVVENTARAALAVAVQRLGLGPEGTSMLTPPAPVRTYEQGRADAVTLLRQFADECFIGRGRPMLVEALVASPVNGLMVVAQMIEEGAP